MLVFKHTTWETHFVLDAQRISVLAVENPAMLWKYAQALQGLADGGDGDFCIYKNLAEQPFDKLCNVETNSAHLCLNTKKLLAALTKKCADLAKGPEQEDALRRVTRALMDFCKDTCQDVGYSVELDEEIDVAGLFKLFSLSLKEVFRSPLENAIEYINVHAELAKTRVFIFLFLTKFLSPTDLKQLFEHCRYQGVSLILIEDVLPPHLAECSIPHQALTIDPDGFELPRNSFK